jgi:hypothetical protein
MLRELSRWTMYLGMLIAMVAGATWPHPTWLGVLGGLVVIGVGVGMKRAAGPAPIDHAEGQSGGAKPARTGTLTEGIASVAEQVRVLSEEAKDADFEHVKKRVEELNWLGAERVGQAQEAIAARVGFAAYAEVMAPLATSERLLYRAWSAAADGHRPEVIASLAAAVPYAREAADVAKRTLQNV